MKSTTAIKTWIADDEQFRSFPYLDNGQYSVGYGHKVGEKEKHLFSGIDKKTAWLLLENDILACEKTIQRLVKVPLTQNQFDSLVSLVYNVGVGAFSRSRMLSRLNQGDYAGAAKEFLDWHHVNHKPNSHLKARRDYEYKLFLTP